MIRAFVVLVDEQSVSRAAEKLGQSQPQLSATLRRMRSLFHDPILVRGSRGMIATEHALMLLETARRMLADAQTLIAPIPFDFSPKDLKRQFHIALPDYLSAPVLARIFAAVRTEAPDCKLVVRSLPGNGESVSLLESGEVDVLIDSELVTAAHVRHRTLFEDEVMLVANAHHPDLKDPLTIQDYLGLPHIAASPGSGLSPGMIDRMLQEHGYARNVVAWLPYLNTIQPILATTDLVFTTSAHLARYLASQGDLQLRAPPLSLPPVRYALMWHDRVHRSTEHQWLRELIRTAVRRETDRSEHA
ncbi:LysR family transcriptional regulator [Variovorax arabinosiphilus]|uniref:LysR family transcriptional regulator n=1 Tax=Variovorax arabinosiphilus TaxID=3053498 RepID=UPI002576AAFD|nr:MULTISPECIES: LysR family transcriptional regulator [unclassified Variovorax]MDM0122394.1 LysR family transcriptional regulator [Variovorax sp. J2L1-78]MDM0131077.1 LysR family transcriptional regulator [Variovorax sp. J2L1-63]MDM0235157.1 LysR family transcriptional regulator [Variovorax sp. J2R1-6]